MAGYPQLSNMIKKKKTLKTRFLRLFLFPSRFSDGEQNVQWTSNHFEPSDHKKVPAVVKQASDITLRISTSRNFNSRQRAGVEWELVLVFAKKSSCFEAFMAYNFTRPNDLLPHHEWKKKTKDFAWLLSFNMKRSYVVLIIHFFRLYELCSCIWWPSPNGSMQETKTKPNSQRLAIVCVIVSLIKEELYAK